MGSVDWNRVFDELHPEPGASEREIEGLLADLMLPLSRTELQEVRDAQKNPFVPEDPLYATWEPFDPAQWSLPARPLPTAYLDFLRFSNGGSFRSGTRSFDTFLKTNEIRRKLLDHWIPEFLPGAIPFAFDSGGGMYGFDMREAPKQGEYLVLYWMAGATFHDDALLAGTSFFEACSGRTDPPRMPPRPGL